MFETLMLSDLPKRQCEILRKFSSTRPTVWVIEEDGVRAIVKDFSATRFFFRNTCGRFLVWREAKAYKRMANLNGVPELYGIIDGLALVIEEIPGKDLEKAETEVSLPDGFFDALEAVVKDIHKRGLAHCDLKRAGNVLLGDDGRPYIIDWASVIFKSEFRIPPFHLIYKRFLQDDYNAIIKRKMRLSPEFVQLDEKERYSRRSYAERVIRTIRDKIRFLLQKFA